MHELHIMPEVWRAASREDREFMLGVRRIMRAMESAELAESRGKGKPAAPSAPVPRKGLGG